MMISRKIRKMYLIFFSRNRYLHFQVSHHMRSLHKLLGEPITRTHQEIQPVLEQLTNDCFPTYSEQLERVRAIHTNRIGTLKMRKRKSLWDDGVVSCWNFFSETNNVSKLYFSLIPIEYGLFETEKL